MKPSLFIGVPRVFDRIYAGVYAKVNAGGAVKKFLFNYGYKWKLSYMLKGHKYNKASFLALLVRTVLKIRITAMVSIS